MASVKITKFPPYLITDQDHIVFVFQGLLFGSVYKNFALSYFLLVHPTMQDLSRDSTTYNFLQKFKNNNNRKMQLHPFGVSSTYVMQTTGSVCPRL